MKKVLFLGGANAQVPVISEAKSRGYHVVTCDYLPDNPGHKLADEYYNVSTTDIPGILDLAIKINPDFIVAYASDPAAPVAAFVSEKLHLPGNTYDSVSILSLKDRFRGFQKELGLNCPGYIILPENDNPAKLKQLRLPFIVKPVDSSGSKGVMKVKSFDVIDDAVRYAFSFSRCRKIIAEEYVDNDIADIHGDGFVVNGELVFACLGDHIYNSLSNPFNPAGTTWPSLYDGRFINLIRNDVASLIKASGFKNGPVNIEARINSEGKHYVMEIGPRSGGYFVPQAIYYATGFDMVKALLDILEGKEIVIPDQPWKSSAYYAIHSDTGGKLQEVFFSHVIRPYIRDFHQYIKEGEDVKPFTGAHAAIGIILLQFPEVTEMVNIMDNIHEHLVVKVLPVE